SANLARRSGARRWRGRHRVSQNYDQDASGQGISSSPRLLCHKASQKPYSQGHSVHGVHIRPTLVDQADESIVLKVAQDLENALVVKPFFLVVLEPIKFGSHEYC